MTRNPFLSAFFPLRLIFGLFLTLFIPVTLNASPVVKLYSPVQGTCATGFLLRGTPFIITNWHVTHSLCVDSKCAAVELVDSKGKSTPPLLLRREFPVLDVAVLERTDGVKAEDGLQFASTPPQIGEQVRVIGFPRCQEMEETAGVITALQSLFVSVSASGAPGSSGSPALNDRGEVVAVIHEAGSLLSAALGRLTDSDFSLEAARGELVGKSLEEKLSNDLTPELKELRDYYLNTVAPLRGIQRFSKGIRFLGASGKIRQHILQRRPDPLIQRTALLLEQPPSVILEARGTEEVSEEIQLLEQVVFLANLELYGATHELFTPLTDEQARQLVANRSSTQQAALLKELQDFSSQNFGGMYREGVLLLIWPAVFLLLYLFLTLWSMGFIWARTRGVFLWRVLVTVLCAVFGGPVFLVVGYLAGFWRYSR